MLAGMSESHPIRSVSVRRHECTTRKTDFFQAFCKVIERVHDSILIKGLIGIDRIIAAT